MKFDRENYVDQFVLPNEGTEDYRLLEKELSERGFGKAQFGKDGYGSPCLLLKGTLLRCKEQSLEEFGEDEQHFLNIYTLYYGDKTIAVHTMHDGDSSLRLDIGELNSLPQSLLPLVSLPVSRHAFVAEQKERPDYNAPDGSEITYLIKGQAGDFGDLCNCKLPIGKTSTAVKHQTVQELWNFTAGNGEFWLKDGDNETVSEVKKGTSVLIHPGVSFQFRNMSQDTTLESTITTMPPWPGPNEAIKVEGKWTPSVHSQNLQEAVKDNTQSSEVLAKTTSPEDVVRPISPSGVKSSLFGNSVSTSSASVTDNTAPTPSNK